jgi:hypothetical protein
VLIGILQQEVESLVGTFVGYVKFGSAAMRSPVCRPSYTGACRPRL